jgi:O-antigen ligase
MQNSRLSVNAISLLLVLVLAFVHPFAYGYDASVAIGFIAWMAIGLCIIICCVGIPAPLHNTKKIVAIFVIMAVVIALRQGPLPISILGAVITLLIMAAWAACASLVVQSKFHFKAFIGALIIAALINALVALYQYFGWAVTYPLPFIKYAEAGNAAGQLNQRNLLAFLCMIGLVALIYSAHLRQGRWIHRAQYAIGVVLTAAVAATASRSGALLVITFAVMVYFSGAYLPALALRMAQCFAALYVLFSAMLPWISGSSGLFVRFVQGENGCNSRRILWGNALTMIRQSPWVGHGWDSFIFTFYSTNFNFRFCEFPDHAHNLFLQLASELGVPFAILAGTYCVWLLLSKRDALKRNAQQQVGYIIVVLTMVYSQTEFPLWHVDFLALFSFGLGLLFANDSCDGAQRVHTDVLVDHSGARIVLCTIGIASFIMGSIGFYQYTRISQLSLPVALRDADMRSDPQQVLRPYWAFANQLRYVHIHNVQVTPDNAQQMLTMSLALLPYAPGPTVLTRIIDSANVLGDNELAAFHIKRFKDLYPDEYGKWVNSSPVKTMGQVGQER